MWLISSRAVLAATIAALAVPSAVSAEQPLWTRVKGWEVRVDRTIGGGCFVTKMTGDGGAAVRIGVNPVAENTYMMVGDGDWRSIKVDETYDVQFEFGNAGPWEGPALGILLGNSKFLWVDVSSPGFMDEFMTESVLTLDTKAKK